MIADQVIEAEHGEEKEQAQHDAETAEDDAGDGGLAGGPLCHQGTGQSHYTEEKGDVDPGKAQKKQACNSGIYAVSAEIEAPWLDLMILIV